MSFRTSDPARRPVLIIRCLFAACVLLAVLAAADVGKAHASYYKLVLCAANNGSNSYEVRTNTASPTNPGGIFNVENYCGPAGDPAGDSAFLRINENQAGGPAGYTAYASASWGTVPWVGIAAAGGYTREPGDFREGWRGRFWAEGYDGSTNNILMQGSGVANGSLGGIGAGLTSTFASHLWPFPGLADYKRFVFELTCMRPDGCDRSGWNDVDANSMVLILNDASPVDLHLTNTTSAPLNGQWVKGAQTATYFWSDQGSGIRAEWIDIDGARNFTIDHASECNAGWSQLNGEFARVFQPCAVAANIPRFDNINTATLSDGAHTVRACAQDYGQYIGLYGTGGASCDQATIRTDNTAPGAPAGLEVTSANPARYLQHFGARWQLPPNQGSPIAAIHYDVVNAAGSEVVPVHTVAGTDPTALSNIEGPKARGEYRLRVWLEDSVGFSGPPSTAPIPRDTTPPAAPQNLAAIGPDSYGPAKGYRLHWQNVVDAGSPIVAAQYVVLDGAGSAVTDVKTVTGEALQAIPGIDVPTRRGDYSARVWLTDEEGNVGAAANVALPRDTTPPAAPQELQVTSPGTSRSAQGFDLRWRNVPDDGSPIVAAHYQVTDNAGKVIVSTQTETGNAIQSIPELTTPTQAGTYKVRVWLEDAEGNQGAPATAPLAYDCVRSEVGGGTDLSAGFGSGGDRTLLVRQDQGATLLGSVHGVDRNGAAVCVWSRVATDQGRDFLGLALTGSDGHYQFNVGDGPSREFTVDYRAGQRELTASAQVRATVVPTLKLRRHVIHNKGFGYFTGSIPGPQAENVVVVLQVRDGKGWRAFRRYRTRADGSYVLRYRFTQTGRATTYVLRAQVPAQGGYPYEEGVSTLGRLRVLP
jgi:hypothetical protein